MRIERQSCVGSSRLALERGHGIGGNMWTRLVWNSGLLSHVGPFEPPALFGSHILQGQSNGESHV